MPSEVTKTPSEGTDVDWGPLAQPIHETLPGDGKAAWKDNAYTAFWDPAQKAFGTVHVSTSPNAEGRRARASLSYQGTSAEIFEDLDPGTFVSESISFELEGSGRVVVDSPDLSMDLTFTPRLALADFNTAGVFPKMGGETPMKHYERTVDITGPCAVKGREFEISATGQRDRSFGYRDESIGIEEYFWFFATFPEFTVVGMRFTGGDEFDRVDGFRLTEDEARRITSVGVIRDAAGLLAEALFKFEDGEEFSARSLGRDGGFWVPMSWERHGPTMSSYNEFFPVRISDGAEGYAVAEHGQLRTLF